jgi:hypothetical protein
MGPAGSSSGDGLHIWKVELRAEQVSQLTAQEIF